MVSKSFYTNLYYRLCESRKTLVSAYGRGSGLHQHHIIPRHAGGTDESSNFTYLTVREHVIAHWLLWKMFGNPNDLRSMKMLGARLSVEHRRIIGRFCFENKIGMHGISRENRQEIGTRSGIKARDEQYGIHDPARENEYRRNAGRASGIKAFKQKTNLFAPEHAEKLKISPSLGGKALSGFVAVTKDGDTRKIHPDNLDEFLSNGWTVGSSYVWIHRDGIQNR